MRIKTFALVCATCVAYVLGVILEMHREGVCLRIGWGLARWESRKVALQNIGEGNGVCYEEGGVGDWEGKKAEGRNCIIDYAYHIGECKSSEFTILALSKIRTKHTWGRI